MGFIFIFGDNGFNLCFVYYFFEVFLCLGVGFFFLLGIKAGWGFWIIFVSEEFRGIFEEIL